MKITKKIAKIIIGFEPFKIEFKNNNIYFLKVKPDEISGFDNFDYFIMNKYEFLNKIKEIILEDFELNIFESKYFVNIELYGYEFGSKVDFKDSTYESCLIKTFDWILNFKGE